MSYKVEIIENLTGAVIKEMFCTSLRNAEKTLDGVFINLNHNSFSARIVEPEIASDNPEAK